MTTDIKNFHIDMTNNGVFALVKYNLNGH